MPILVGKSPHIFDLLVEASAQHDGSLHLQSCAVKPVLPATDRADAWGKAENVFIKSMGMTIYLSTCLPIYLSVCRCMYIPTTAWKSKAGSRNLEIWLLKVYIYISAYNVIMYIYIIYIYIQMEFSWNGCTPNLSWQYSKPWWLEGPPILILRPLWW